jgi:hypothetical protein
MQLGQIILTEESVMQQCSFFLSSSVTINVLFDISLILSPSLLLLVIKSLLPYIIHEITDKFIINQSINQS